MKQERFLGPAVSATVMLIYLQALRVAFSVLFGVIYDQIFEGPTTAWLAVSVVLILGALVAPAIVPRMPTRTWIGASAIIAAVARVAISINDAQVRYWSALVVLAAGGIYIGSLLARNRKEAFRALIVALILDQVLRVAGDTYDLSYRPAWLIPQILWSALIVLAAIVLLRDRKEEHDQGGGLHLLGGLALGACLFVETSLLSLPNAVSRWTNGSYPWVAVLLLAVTMLPLVPWLWRIRWMRTIGARLGLVAASTAALLWGYFGSGVAAWLALIVVQALLLAGLAHLMLNPLTRPRRAGTSLALGMLLFMVLNFLNAFAFTYPYTLPEMREMGWLVYLLAMLVFGLGIIVHRAATGTPSGVALRTRWAAFAGLLALAIAVISVRPVEAEPLPERGSLRLATYNIHYGYDDVWHLTLEDQVRAIMDSEVDVIAMQEVDAGRMTSYGVDNAYFLARQLGMNAAYLPAVEHLTGIAVLYRGPVAPTRQRLLTSLQEQTGIVGVSLQTDAGDLDFYGIWMGLSDEDTQRQIEEAIAFIGDSSPAAFGGDFNARPDEAVALAVLDAGFIEPFVALGQEPVPPTSPAINPRSQIDYVWLRDLVPLDAWVPDALSSDHRMVVVEVKWQR